MNKELINNITGNFYSDEWYTDKKTVDLCWKLLDVQQSDVICCPFDSEKSLFVQKAIENGIEVIYGIRDFIGSANYQFTKLMTNPPFSLKDAVIETVYRYGKPSALILPLDSLGGVKRHSIYAQFGEPSIYLPSKRINYFDEFWEEKQGSNFHSIIMLFNQIKYSGIIWEFKDNEVNENELF